MIYGRKKLEMICESVDGHSSNYYQEVINQLNNLLAQEESYQHQMEKLFWLKDGDLNTKYFHFVASTRNDICNVAKSYFQILFIIIIIIISPLLSIMMLLTMLIVAFLMTSIYILSPFYILMSFLCLFMFLSFFGRQVRFPLLLHNPQL